MHRSSARPGSRSCGTRLRGELLQPGDDGYDEAKRVWNGAHDGAEPAVIARCTGPADVIAALGFARAHDLTVAVRGGGHSIPGYSTTDGGMVIDLGPMQNVRVDPAARRAYVGAGAVWGDVDHETQQFGLATTGGLVSTTGVAGFTLGGGIGWLMRQYGLACDNLVGADVVTADGRLVHASEDENADLFWGLRGGGGNFGIVTSLRARAAPGRARRSTPARCSCPPRRTSTCSASTATGRRSSPDAITTAISLATAPPLPVIPEEWHGKKVAIVIAVCAGPVEDGEALVRELRTIAEPVADLIHPMPYTFIQSLLDPLWPKGINAYFKAANLAGLSDETIDSLATLHQDTPGPQCEIHVHQMGGAVATGRRGRHGLPGALDAVRAQRRHGDARGRRCSARTPSGRGRSIASAKADQTGRAYVNFLGETGARPSPPTARRRTGRLVALKDEYDPTNVFRLNQNIAPSA